MKQYLIIFLVAISAGLFAQKIKVKKGVIYNNKEKIGTSTNSRSEDGTYIRTISDLNGHSANLYKDDKETETYDDDVFIVSTNFSSGTMEIHPFFLKSFVLEKSLVEYLMGKGLWTENGMDEALIKKEIASNTKLVGAAAENKKRAEELNPFVKRTGEIVKGGYEGTEVIGYVESPDHFLKTTLFPIKIYDIDHNLVAKGTSKVLTDEKFTTFDGKEHKFVIKHELNELTKPLFLSEVVYQLLLSGYVYGGEHPFDVANNTLAGQ